MTYRLSPRSDAYCQEDQLGFDKYVDTLKGIIHRTSQYLNALRAQAMNALGDLKPPKFKVKSYIIAIAIPGALIVFNIFLMTWQVSGYPF